MTELCGYLNTSVCVCTCKERCSSLIVYASTEGIETGDHISEDRHLLQSISPTHHTNKDVYFSVCVCVCVCVCVWERE